MDKEEFCFPDLFIIPEPLPISPTWRKFILLGFTKNVNLHCMYPLYLMSSEYQYLRKDKPHGSVGGLYNFRDLIMEDGPV
ncbi:mannose-1-phosphate guanylyltransferase [Ranunculus cassubicifolius]